MTTRAVRRLRRRSSICIDSPSTPLEVKRTYAVWSRCMRKFVEWDRKRRSGRPAATTPPVAIRWVCSFDDFLADVGLCPPGRTIKPFNSSQPLGPSNWIWGASPSQGTRGRKPQLIELDGVERSAREWAQEFGLAESALRYKLSRGATMNQIQQQSTANR